MFSAALKFAEAKYPRFNRERLSFQDLKDICKTEEIFYFEVRDIPEKNLKSYIQWPWPPEINETIIVVNKECSDSVKWFCLGHELGHYFLHPPHVNRDTILALEKGGYINKVYVDEFKQAYENEADIFATMLFIPEKELLDQFEKSLRPFRDEYKRRGAVALKEISKIEERVFMYLESETIRTLQKQNPQAKNIVEEAQNNLRLRAQSFVRSQIWPSPFALVPGTID
ncbi:MAG TPA: ImmA/IrrE family metallo-endopeptidase [bacterium]|nr:ImmA/IrrE family metallo-endopeptidase [bacterium]